MFKSIFTYITLNLISKFLALLDANNIHNLIQSWKVLTISNVFTIFVDLIQALTKAHEKSIKTYLYERIS